MNIPRLNYSEITDDFLKDSIRVLTAAPNPNHRRKNSPDYYDLISAFDIETTNFPDEEIAVCYSWAFQYGLRFTILGRTIQEAVELFKRIAGFCSNTMLVYVHNLSFEFQFLKGVYDFVGDDIFATDPRKILKCSLFEKIEMRCSYFLSNMSLSRFCQLEGVEHQKLSGEEFDYTKIRYPWTPLTEKEIDYQVHDVLGLVEAVYSIMEKLGDTVYTIPLTNTGYVRRDAKRALQPLRNYIISLLPDKDLYLALRRAFRGGNTHASRFRAGNIEKNVLNVDEASAYPAVQLTELYPVKPFFRVQHSTFDRLTQLMKRKKALLMHITLWDLCLKEHIPVPYVSKSKAITRGIISEDNGRLMYAEYCELYLTDIDFRIILNQYNFKDIKVVDLWYSSYGRLPESLRGVTMEYFTQKTALKGIDDYLYMKAKNRLNSVYGMSAQDPVRAEMRYEGQELVPVERNIKDALEEYARNPLMPYQWGVWVTAHARARLQELIDLVPWDQFCYCDTDSVKYTGEPVDFTSFNEKRIKEDIEQGYHATDKKGVTRYIGVAEPEPAYDTFKTLGAKKYAYTQGGKMHITIAGVNKKKGAEELEAAGGLDAMKEGFTFQRGGGTESVYRDNYRDEKIIDGHTLIITDCVCIKDSTYTLGLTYEYKEVLSRDNLLSLRKKDLI